MTRPFIRLTCASLALATLGASTLADTTAEFTVNAEGWVVAGPDPDFHISVDPPTLTATWDDVNGQPAGSVRVPDIYSWTWVGAPASWLGNRVSAFGGTLRCDQFIRVTDNAPWPAFALRGRNISLYSINTAPPIATWTTVSKTITGASFRVNDWDNGPVATDAQVVEVLADLRGVYILTEWHTGTDDTNIDNISMSGTPVPVCIGDVNHDGATNSADFNILASNFGNSVGPNTSGDLTGDGQVNSADFNVLAGDFGCGG